jgi:hypothetical protein
MDRMQQVAADKLALDAAQRKAVVSARTLTEATAARESIEVLRKAKAETAAQIEADALAVKEAERAAEEAEQAAEDAERKAYEDALGTEAEARDRADEDAREVQRLTEVDARNKADAEIPKLERTASDRERLLGADHPETVAARDELERARETARRPDRDARSGRLPGDDASEEVKRQADARAERPDETADAKRLSDEAKKNPGRAGSPFPAPPRN